MSESDSVMVMIWTESLGMAIWLFSALHALSLVQIFLQIGKMTQKGELLTHARLGPCVVGMLANHSSVLFQVLMISHRWKYSRVYVYDGNFHAEHMRMRRPDLDVALTNGEGYMVETTSYSQHLKVSVEHKQVSDACLSESNSHLTPMVWSRNLPAEITRPTMLPVLFQRIWMQQVEVHVLVAVMAVSPLTPSPTFKRENGLSLSLSFHLAPSDASLRQMNADYSICNALRYRTQGLTDAKLAYDICCQWWINFFLRLEKGQFLSLPEGLKITPAVGSFHLASHIPECFVLYSLHFIRGAGQLDGEILETLWSDFNKISPWARSMTASHRREIYDDHMRDSNWKKLTGMCELL